MPSMHAGTCVHQACSVTNCCCCLGREGGVPSPPTSSHSVGGRAPSGVDSARKQTRGHHTPTLALGADHRVVTKLLAEAAGLDQLPHKAQLQVVARVERDNVPNRQTPVARLRRQREGALQWWQRRAGAGLVGVAGRGPQAWESRLGGSAHAENRRQTFECMCSQLRPSVCSLLACPPRAS